jgi:hypothetical protein
VHTPPPPQNMIPPSNSTLHHYALLADFALAMVDRCSVVPGRSRARALRDMTLSSRQFEDDVTSRLGTHVGFSQTSPLPALCVGSPLQGYKLDLPQEISLGYDASSTQDVQHVRDAHCEGGVVPKRRQRWHLVHSTRKGHARAALLGTEQFREVAAL